MAEIRHPEADLSTADLIRHAVNEAKLLARAEVTHAKMELKQELHAARNAGIALGAALVLALTGVALLFVALALALPIGEGLAALLVGVVLLGIAAIAGLAGAKKLPKQPMYRTRDRLLSDVTLTKERFV